jgi:hypothetical protein
MDDSLADRDWHVTVSWDPDSGGLQATGADGAFPVKETLGGDTKATLNSA